MKKKLKQIISVAVVLCIIMLAINHKKVEFNAKYFNSRLLVFRAQLLQCLFVIFMSCFNNVPTIEMTDINTINFKIFHDTIP